MESNSTEQQSKKRKKKGSGSCFKKACRAIKGTFSRSRKNKVVPFTSQSVLDPADPQPGPSGFKPAAPKEPSDHRPGASNLEQNASQDHPKPCLFRIKPNNRKGPSKQQDPSDSHPAKQQTSGNKKGSRSCFKRAWRAIKGTFSHSRNKVVPLPSPSDLDLSDPQADSIVQTHLRVFKPVGFQDPDDFLPGSCNWEQTPVEDLSGPESGPSGLQEADDSQPSRSYSLLYKQECPLGMGCKGIVYQGIRRSDGQKVAIKYIDTTWDSDYIPGPSKPLFREVALNQLLHKPEKCPYIVEMLDWFKEDNHIIIIMEFPRPSKTLYDFVQDHGFGLDETLARDFMRQAVVAAKHWIDHGVNHNDIHMSNVLVNTDTLQIKFIDFGCGQLIATRNAQVYGYCDQAHAVAETVHNLGNLLADMLYPYLNNRVVIRGTSDECRDLIYWSTSVEPANTPTLEEFMNHRWFNQA